MGITTNSYMGNAENKIASDAATDSSLDIGNRQMNQSDDISKLNSELNMQALLNSTRKASSELLKSAI